LRSSPNKHRDCGDCRLQRAPIFPIIPRQLECISHTLVDVRSQIYRRPIRNAGCAPPSIRAIAILRAAHATRPDSNPQRESIMRGNWIRSLLLSSCLLALAACGNSPGCRAVTGAAMGAAGGAAIGALAGNPALGAAAGGIAGGATGALTSPNQVSAGFSPLCD